MKRANFVAEVAGHHIYKHDDGRFDLWTAGIGWWGFGLPTIKDARRVCRSAKNVRFSPSPDAHRDEKARERGLA